MTTPGLILDASASKLKAPSTLTLDSNIDFNQHQAVKFRVENISPPSPGNPGRMILDGTVLKYDDGSSFQALSTSVSAFSGDVTSTTQTYLSASVGPVVIRDDNGLSLRDSA